jgi:hypothetical protein
MLILIVLVVAAAIGTYALLRNRPPPSPPLAQKSEQATVDLTNLPGSKFEVTYQPETVVIDPATTKKSFEGISADGAILVFNTSAPAITGLKAGSVLLLQGVALKKVVAVETEGDSIIVATKPATLTDAIQDGHIHFEAPITFDAGPVHNASARSIAGMLLSPASMLATPPLTVATVAAPPGSGSEGDWKFTSKATNEGGNLNLDVNIKGELEGENVDVTAKGHVQSFGLMTDIEISHGVVEQFKYVAKNLRGDVKVDFVATKKGDGMIKGLEVKLPGAFEIPLVIGGFPFALSIGETVIVKPALSGKNQVAEGHFNIKYGGGQGFSVSGPGMAAEGEPENESEITGSSSLGIAPFAYILAMGMPRIELTLGLEKATGFDKLTKAIPSTITDRAAELLRTTKIGSQIVDVVEKTLKSEAAAHIEMVLVANHLDSGPLVLIPCKKTTFETFARVGYNVNALGKTAEGSKEMDLATKQIVQQIPPNIKCGE